MQILNLFFIDNIIKICCFSFFSHLFQVENFSADYFLIKIKIFRCYKIETKTTFY